MSALRLDGVSVTLGGATVLRDVALDVAEGEWTAVVGPNGAGKSTLLRAIAGLVPHEGDVELLGSSRRGRGRRAVARTVALVPQAPVTPGYMSVAEYVALGRTPHLTMLRPAGPRDHEAVRRAIELLDLCEFEHRALGSLSGGERQRAVLARAVAQEAPILLLDEPTTALDLGRQQQALDLVQRLRQERGLTVVAALHDLTMAALHADRLVLLREGEITFQGSPKEVLTKERIAHTYDVAVQVIDVGGVPAILPVRTIS